MLQTLASNSARALLNSRYGLLVSLNSLFDSCRTAIDRCGASEAKLELHWYYTALTHMARDARTHRALLSDDVVTKMMSFLELDEDWEAVLTCKAWSACWRRRCRGVLHCVHRNVGEFGYATHVTPRPGGGAIVVNYGAASGGKKYGSLETYSPEGALLGSCVVDFPGMNSHTGWCPKALAHRGDGTAWLLLGDDAEIVCVRLLSESSISRPIMKIEMIPWRSDGNYEWVHPEDIALAGDVLLVLCHGSPFGQVVVFDNQTGARLRTFGSTGEDWRDQLRGPEAFAVHDQYCFIADTHNQAIKVFDWRDGTLVRVFGKLQDQESDVKPHDDMERNYSSYWEWGDSFYYYDDVRKGDEPGEFDCPAGVAVRDGKLYVSEFRGCRIQVFRLPQDLRGSSDLEVLQIIDSPDFPKELSGLCVEEGGRVWCMGPLFNNTNYVHVFEPCV